MLGCATNPSLEPYRGAPFFDSDLRLAEYAVLACIKQPPGCTPRAAKVRAWIREADRTIRANNALRGEP